MKEFRTNDEGLFLCEECGQSFTCKENVSKHIKHHGMTVKEYYEKWILESTYSCICKECGKPVHFKHQYCSIQ